MTRDEEPTDSERYLTIEALKSAKIFLTATMVPYIGVGGGTEDPAIIAMVEVNDAYHAIDWYDLDAQRALTELFRERRKVIVRDGWTPLMFDPL